jgi:hypothetical protein
MLIWRMMLRLLFFDVGNLDAKCLDHDFTCHCPTKKRPFPNGKNLFSRVKDGN